VISRQWDARYTANIGPNIARILQFTLCELWSRTYTMHLQLRIVMPQYSTEPDCAATRDMPSFGCALCCNIGAIYSAHPSVYALWTVVPAIYYVITAPHIQASIFKWTYLCRYWRYVDKLMIKYCKDAHLHLYCRYVDNSNRVILHIYREIQPTSSSLRYVNSGPCQV
jgi:hypothetical protein